MKGYISIYIEWYFTYELKLYRTLSKLLYYVVIYLKILYITISQIFSDNFIYSHLIPYIKGKSQS